MLPGDDCEGFDVDEPKIKRPVGRPRTTVEDLPENWEQIIMDCGQEGGSAVEMRCLLGIGQSAWETLLADSDDFRITVKAAQDLCEVWWERTGRGMAVGNDGNATVWIFNMKNRFGWRDKQDIEHSNPDGSMRPQSVDAALVQALVDKLVD